MRLADPDAAVFGAIATGMALPYLLVGLLPGLVKFLPKPGAWMETLKEVLGFVMLARRTPTWRAAVEGTLTPSEPSPSLV